MNSTGIQNTCKIKKITRKFESKPADLIMTIVRKWPGVGSARKVSSSGFVSAR